MKKEKKIDESSPVGMIKNDNILTKIGGKVHMHYTVTVGHTAA